MRFTHLHNARDNARIAVAAPDLPSTGGVLAVITGPGRTHGTDSGCLIQCGALLAGAASIAVTYIELEQEVP